MAPGVIAALRGEWVQARSKLEHTELLLADAGTNPFWETITVRTMLQLSLGYLGDLHELFRRARENLDDAELRGSMLEVAHLRMGWSHLIYLAHDNPERALRVTEEVQERWSHRTAHLQRYMALHAQTQARIYAGQGTVAAEKVEGRWTSLRRSRVLFPQFLRVEAHALRARAHLAAAAEDRKRAASHMALALGSAERLEEEDAAWATAIAHGVRASIALLTDPNEAVGPLERAVGGFEGANMALYGASARLRLGELLGGSRGEALKQSALDYMQAQGVMNPDRMAALFVPARE
jgi:hypothetical protein